MAAALLPWVKPQFSDAAGSPVASGKLYSFIAGTTTPQPTYSDPALDTPHANTYPIQLNAAGESPTCVYLLPTAYQFRLDGANAVTLWTDDGPDDVGAACAAGVGVGLTARGKAVTSGDTVLATGRLRTVNSAGGPSPCVII